MRRPELFADAMCFPFSQSEMLKRFTFPADPGMDAQLFQTTAAPPVPMSHDTQLDCVYWVRSQLSNNGIGIVSRPEDLNFIGVDRMAVLGLQLPSKNPNVGALRRADVRVMTLAYTKESSFGGGFATPDAPLTKAGENLIREMKENGMILDLSHAGHRTARDAMRVVEKLGGPKVMVSHSGCWDVYDHPRNLPLDVFEGVKTVGGVVGICTPGFLLDASENDLSGFYRHIEFCLRKLGESAVVIGSDEVYRTLDPEIERKNFDMMNKELDPSGTIFRARFPANPPELNRPDKMATLKRRLMEKGYPPRIISKVLGENLFRFFEESL